MGFARRSASPLWRSCFFMFAPKAYSIAHVCVGRSTGLLKKSLCGKSLKTTMEYMHPDLGRIKSIIEQERISKRHFLGYAARYIRRPPIAQHRFREIDGSTIKFVTKDTATKEIVLDQIPREEFIQTLADHVPEKYCHAIRYYGLLAPRTRNRIFTILHRLLRQKRRPRPRPLSWAELIRKSFNRNPLIDSRGQPMRIAGRYFPSAA
jgi:hypothetical protein